MIDWFVAGIVALVSAGTSLNMGEHTAVMALRRLVQRIKQTLTRSPFLTHVLAVSSSAVIAQVVGVVAGPILTRLYAPSEFGLYAVLAACFGALNIIASLRYEGALPVAKDDVEGVHLLLLATLLTVFAAAVTLVVALVAADRISLLLTKDVQLARYLWYLPIGVFFSSMWTIFARWAVRKQAFSQLSLARVSQSILGSVCTIGMGLLRFGTLGLIVGSMVGSSSSVSRLSLVALADFRRCYASLSFKGIIQVAIRHYQFPLYNTWAVLLNVLSVQVPVFFLTRGFGDTYTGYFSLCQRMLLLPTMFVASAIAPVFYSRARLAHEDGTLTALTVRILDSIAGLNAFFVIAVALFGQPLFAFVFGARWAHAGLYAAALAPWLLFNFLCTPISTLPLVFERQGKDLIFQAALFVVRAGSLMIGVHFKNDVLAMQLFGASSAVFMLVYLGWLLSLVQVPLWRVLLSAFREIAIAGVLVGACRVVLWVSHENWIITGVVAIPVAAYALWRVLGQIRRSRSLVQAPTA